MSRDLLTLQRWATDMADTDPDEAARPLWARIAGEVDAYLTGGESDPIEGDQPFDFEALP